MDNKRVFNAYLEQQQIDFLQRQARQNDRSAAAELRKLVRERMQAEDRAPTTISQFGRTA